MTHHPIHTLSPPELRGYARGLRETAALLGASWSRSGMVEADDMSLLVTATREAWEREAELVEGFAARLEGEQDQRRPVTAERVAAWVASFEPPIQGFAAAPTPEEEAQPGLADAVAESLAAQPAPRPPANPGWPAAKIEEARQMLVEQGLSYRTVAERTGIPPGTISGWAFKRGWLDQRQPSAEDHPAREPLVWTEARLALLDAAFPTADLHELLDRVNRLPASSPCLSVAAMRQKAKLRGLRRTKPAESPDADEAEAAPPATPTTPPIKPTPAMLPEDKAEAREKLRTGEFKGAAAIMEEYGCTQEEAMELVEEHRARMGKAA